MTERDNESWKHIPRFPGYDVSDQGRVRSYHKREKGQGETWIIAKEPQRILKGAFKAAGYRFVVLRKRGISHTVPVHRLVTRAFLGPCPRGLQVCHNDGKSKNNTLSNLRYDTPRANIQDALRHGHMKRSLTPRQVTTIRLEAKRGVVDSVLADRFDVSQGIIQAARRGKTYGYVETTTVTKPPITTAKLSASQAREIYKAVAAGIQYSVLENQYRVSKSTVSRIMSGERWSAATADLRAQHPHGGAQKGVGDG